MKIRQHKKEKKISAVKSFARSKKTNISETFFRVFKNYYEESIEIYKHRRRISNIQATNIYNYVIQLFEICLAILHKKLTISERFIIIKIRKKKYIEQYLINQIHSTEIAFNKLSLI